MIVVLDTNVLVQARAAGHAYHPILQAWLAGDLILAVSAEIMLEYEEVVTERAGAARWAVIERLLAMPDGVVRVSPTFRFQRITVDPDDNKFVDCAIVANADWIITEDRHFDVMNRDKGKPLPIKPSEFIQRFLSGI
jgi:putative PIN family toxin of toxin-antitoxin system